MAVVVFANEYPNYSELSSDRWQTATLGEGSLSNLSMTPCFTPNEFPFISPPDMPNLSENFDFRAYIDGLDVNEEDITNTIQHSSPPIPNLESNSSSQSTPPSIRVDLVQGKIY